MWSNIGLDKCTAFISSEFQAKGKSSSDAGPARPAITISRMAGAGGHAVASALAEYLQSHVSTHDEWTVFDKNLVEKVLEDHHMHKRIADFMEEGRKSMLQDSLEEWMGLHPSAWTLVQQTSATILQLAKIGQVILVGRGAMVTTRKLKTVFHVRLVASLEKRIKRVEEVYGLKGKAAADYVLTKDEGRRHYIKDNFEADIDDPLLYHVVINTDMLRYDEAARLIGNEVIARYGLARSRESARK